MKFSALSLAALLAMAASSPAMAVLQFRTVIQTAVNNCQTALPIFDGSFRNRPLAISNEGTSTGFISCAFAAQTTNATGIRFIQVFFLNRRDTAVDITCTLANARTGAVATFFPKIFTVRAGELLGGFWSSVDNAGNPFSLPGVSCAIPPGVDITDSRIDYSADVGA